MSNEEAAIKSSIKDQIPTFKAALEAVSTAIGDTHKAQGQHDLYSKRKRRESGYRKWLEREAWRGSILDSEAEEEKKTAELPWGCFSAPGRAGKKNRIFLDGMLKLNAENKEKEA
jgi:hypothetical protein